MLKKWVLFSVITAFLSVLAVTPPTQHFATATASPPPAPTKPENQPPVAPAPKKAGSPFSGLRNSGSISGEYTLHIARSTLTNNPNLHQADDDTIRAWLHVTDQLLREATNNRAWFGPAQFIPGVYSAGSECDVTTIENRLAPIFGLTVGEKTLGKIPREHLMVLLPADPRCAEGQAWPGAAYVATYSQNVFIHEVLHMFGLGHSGRLRCAVGRSDCLVFPGPSFRLYVPSGQFSPYGNEYTVMSGMLSRAPGPLSLEHLLVLGYGANRYQRLIPGANLITRAKLRAPNNYLIYDDHPSQSTYIINYLTNQEVTNRDVTDPRYRNRLPSPPVPHGVIVKKLHWEDDYRRALLIDPCVFEAHSLLTPAATRLAEGRLTLWLGQTTADTAQIYAAIHQNPGFSAPTPAQPSKTAQRSPAVPFECNQVDGVHRKVVQTTPVSKTAGSSIPSPPQPAKRARRVR